MALTVALTGTTVTLDETAGLQNDDTNAALPAAFSSLLTALGANPVSGRSGQPGESCNSWGDVMTTVLVCELSEIKAVGIEAVLKLAACKVVRHCRSGDEMLRIAGLLRPKVIIADSRTLGDEAIATFRKLQADNRRPSIIILVEKNPGITAAELVEFNVDGLLMRDASAATLLECVKCVLEGRPWFDPDLLPHLACPQPTMATTDNLTSRERQIMHLVALGMSNKAIARQATLSEGTVKMYLHHILTKLRLANRTQLATYAHATSQRPSAWHRQSDKHERPSAARDLQRTP